MRNRFPRLQNANLRPAPREYSGPGLYDEAQRTGGGPYSFEADFEGTTIQLDDITPEGEIVDIKMRDTARTIGRERQWAPPAPGERVPRDVDELMKGRAAAKPSRWRDIETIREEYGPDLARQVRFASDHGLNGVVWQTNTPWMWDTVNRMIKDYDFLSRYPRLSVRAELLP